MSHDNMIRSISCYGYYGGRVASYCGQVECLICWTKAITRVCDHRANARECLGVPYFQAYPGSNCDGPDQRGDWRNR